METIVVVGSKPDALMPDIPATHVLSANAAIDRAIEYRARFGSKVIALVNSTEVYIEHLRTALTRGRPDEIVFLGEAVEDPLGFVRGTLGLPDTKVSVVSFRARHYLFRRTLGWRATLAMLDYARFLPLRYVATNVLPDLVWKRTHTWMSRSSGLNAIFYALERFPNTSVVAAGIGLSAGGHFYESEGPIFTEKTARVDRYTVARWTPAKHARLETTDPTFAEVGRVAMWKGKTFSN
ncbi:hypothetical protein A2704_02585 [Candidatus Kaiserbacteria bacterium RIFCSPHIGHO2_01_FULL_54_36b]|uniref:Uncharacterized protein n=1 Tax=Candidatus Kaiserbacteria bacterium RIFCSPHIGHO2_01_FULL_54_36b TaxID=1798483 RepID=A0A1F6CLS7_9BACT|nr:MAG: hypothetical protein A2704_02585 [Candidatus Kaiserbacteria bacterium RIFCSPHIGHO2_01_FULL_54_36b]